MGFDVKKFMKAAFKRREKIVKLTSTEAKHFAPEGEDPEFVVQGLTGQELGFCKEEGKRMNVVKAAVEAIAGQSHNEKVQGFKKILGTGDDIVEDVAYRIALLQKGVKTPTIDLELALKICGKFGVDFYSITNEVIILSGQGFDLAKSKPVGAK